MIQTSIEVSDTTHLNDSTNNILRNDSISHIYNDLKIDINLLIITLIISQTHNNIGNHRVTLIIYYVNTIKRKIRDIDNVISLYAACVSFL